MKIKLTFDSQAELDSWVAAQPRAEVSRDPGPLPRIAPERVKALLVASRTGKIQAIKEVRELTGLGLKEAKELVEGSLRYPLE